MDEKTGQKNNQFLLVQDHIKTLLKEIGSCEF
jgi:hypothetical protein